MRGKIQPGPTGRRLLALGGLALASLAWIGQPAEVSGRVTMLDKGKQPGDDVGQAVLWLSGPPAQSRPPVQAEIGTSNKEFSPHVLVVPVGSTVSFPNHDPFNHNVFSLSEEHPFDLGLYGRDEVRSVRFERPGIVRVYCNVHARGGAGAGTARRARDACRGSGGRPAARHRGEPARPHPAERLSHHRQRQQQ